MGTTSSRSVAIRPRSTPASRATVGRADGPGAGIINSRVGGDGVSRGAGRYEIVTGSASGVDTTCTGAESPPRDMDGPIITLRGQGGASVRIDRFPVVLGRSIPGAPIQPDCDVAALDPKALVSKQHARLEWHDGERL